MSKTMTVCKLFMATDGRYIARIYALGLSELLFESEFSDDRNFCIYQCRRYADMEQCNVKYPDTRLGVSDGEKTLSMPAVA